MAKTEQKTVAQNKKAYHDYFVLETYEAGIELFGTEVKSVRAGKVNLKESWCNVVNGEMLANGVHISPYELGYDPGFPVPGCHLRTSNRSDDQWHSRSYGFGNHHGADLPD